MNSRIFSTTLEYTSYDKKVNINNHFHLYFIRLIKIILFIFYLFFALLTFVDGRFSTNLLKLI